MASYQYIAKVRMQVDGKWREPGEQVPEAASWRNLMNYISTGKIQEIAVADGVKAPGAVEKPDRVAKSYAPKEEPGPPRPPELAERLPSDVTTELRCWNCREPNHVPADLQAGALFQCHFCSQPQTVSKAKQHAGPFTVVEWQRSIDARSPLVGIRVQNPHEEQDNAGR